MKTDKNSRRRRLVKTRLTEISREFAVFDKQVAKIVKLCAKLSGKHRGLDLVAFHGEAVSHWAFVIDCLLTDAYEIKSTAQLTRRYIGEQLSKSSENGRSDEPDVKVNPGTTFH